MKEYIGEFLILIGATLIFTVVLERIIIPILKSHKVGQKIYDLGPRWHKSKENTPTMGGIGFIIPMLVVLLAVFVREAIWGNVKDFVPLALTVCLAVFNGMIGFLDDYSKLIKKQNEGLTAPQKFALQLFAASLYVAAMALTGNLGTSLSLPFTDHSLELGFAYYILAVILIVGIVNGVNLTDGIDGLAASITAVTAATFAVIAFVYASRSLEILSALLIGAAIGFLVYNFHPAKVFMGDTGSLYIGGMIAGIGFMINEPIVVLIAAMVFILEMLSSFLQVIYFKLTHGKRLFKMAPVHHHFEKCGWGEVKIVGVFSLVSLIFGVIAFFAM